MGFEMQEKTASTEVYEGLTVRHRHRTDDLEFGDMRGYLGPLAVPAAAAYFQAKRDEELGRWRWPENPQFVVYRFANSIRVVDETDGVSVEFQISDVTVDSFAFFGPYSAAAQAYFEAHPERRPWEDAKPGEAWEITYTALAGPDVTKFAIRTDRGTWKTDVLEMEFNHAITSARRIWPEDES